MFHLVDDVGDAAVAGTSAERHDVEHRITARKPETLDSPSYNLIEIDPRLILPDLPEIAGSCTLSAKKLYALSTDRFKRLRLFTPEMLCDLIKYLL